MTSAGAAIFDLDRTLLPGGSGPTITAALSGAGLVPPWQANVANLTYGVYDRLGENRLSMELARRAVSRSVGWDCEQVNKAARAAAEVLEARVLGRARRLVEEHRAAGLPVVMATTTALPLVAPLAERLGFTDVVATLWKAEDGCYTGKLEGPFVWGPAKLKAVRDWADAHSISMEHSFAYSDSIYDLPLLEAVGHPHATNPDARLRAAAVMRRWSILDLAVPEGVLAVAGREALDGALHVLRPAAFPWARWRFEGLDLIPDAGAALIACSDDGPLVALALALAGARRGRKVRFAGDTGVLGIPVVDRILGSATSEEAVRDLIDQGEVVAVLGRDSGDIGADVSVRVGIPLRVTVALSRH